MIYRLIPKGSFHFGRTGIGVEESGEIIHSDTLFAALASAWSVLGGEYGKADLDHNLQILAPFASGRPPFKISSAFPYAGDILFLPCPLVRTGKQKYLKKVRYVSLGALRKLKAGAGPEDGELIQGGLVWVTAEERGKIIDLLLQSHGAEKRNFKRALFRENPSEIRLWNAGEENKVARVALDRVTGKSALYFQGQVKFARGCGLYFWAEFNDLSYKNHLNLALRFLEDEGIGGRKSCGHGQFSLKEEDIPLPAMEGAGYQMVLSLYHPTKEEVEAGILARSQYELVKRCGWSRLRGKRDQRQRALNMLKEGSVFPVDAGLKGTLTDVRAINKQGHPLSEQPAWRYGLALTVPLALDLKRR